MHVQEAGVEDCVEFVPRHVTDEETARYRGRSDAVVLPDRAATGAGVVAAAYRYRRPVIASRLGGLRDIVVDGKTGLLIPPEDPQALAAEIRRFAEDGIEDAAMNIPQVDRIHDLGASDG